MGGEGEGDRIEMREGGVKGRSITMIDKLRISVPGGNYITTVGDKQTCAFTHDAHTHTTNKKYTHANNRHTQTHALTYTTDLNMYACHHQTVPP